MLARNTNVPFKGRIQKRKTHDLWIITFDFATRGRSIQMGQQRKWPPSFDYLIGLGEQRRRNRQAERLSGLEVDDEFEFGRLLEW
jgi:hypothetical protein